MKILITEGPMSHDQPAYARVPGIRVYGMMCNGGNSTNSRTARAMRPERSSGKSVIYIYLHSRANKEKHKQI